MWSALEKVRRAIGTEVLVVLLLYVVAIYAWCIALAYARFGAWWTLLLGAFAPGLFAFVPSYIAMHEHRWLPAAVVYGPPLVLLAGFWVIGAVYQSFKGQSRL